MGPHVSVHITDHFLFTGLSLKDFVTEKSSREYKLSWEMLGADLKPFMGHPAQISSSRF